MKHSTTLIIALLASSSAISATTSNTLQASATLNGACTVSAKGINLGVFVGVAQQNFNNTITILCSRGTAYHLHMGGIEAPETLYRYMRGVTAGNTSKLRYQMWLPRGVGYQNEDSNAYEYSYVGTGSAENLQVSTYMMNDVKYITPDVYTQDIPVTLTF